MMTDKGIVTSGQIFILLFISKVIMAVFYSPVIFKTNSLWDLLLPVIISIILSLFMLIPVLCMYKQNRCMSISEYSRNYFGKAGNIVTILYSVYFFINCLYSLANYYLFLKYIAPEGIQIWMIIATLIIACIYASFKGIEAISRLSGIVLVTVIISIIVFMSFLLPSISQDNYIPIEYSKFDSTIDGIIFVLSRMNDIAVLAMLYPITKGNIIRGAVVYNISVFMIFIAIILLLTGSLGEYLNSQLFPIYQSIDGSGTLQRLNPMFIAVFTSGIFCKISMLLYVISQCIKNVSNEKLGRRFTIISGIAVTLICLLVINNYDIMEALFNKYLNFIFTIIFVILIPLIIVIISKVKKNKKYNHKSKRHLKIFSLIMAVLISSTMFSGCNTTQLNQRFIIQGIGIDKISDKYKLTLIVLDTDSEENENAIKLIYTEGRSIDEAISSLESRNRKNVLFSQCLFIMMNNDAIENCDATLEYFTNNNDILKNTNLMVSEKTAEQTITSAINDMKYKSADINALSDSQSINQAVVQCSLLDYISLKNNPYSGIIIPYIVIDKNISALKSEGSIILKQSSQTNFLTNNETFGALIINKEADNYTETIVSKDNIETTYTIKSIISTIKPKISNNNLIIEFKLNISLDKSYDNETQQLIYNDIYEKVKTSIDKTIIENGCDVFSLNKSIRAEYSGYYNNINNWEEILKNAETNIDITVIYGNVDICYILKL